MMRMIAHSAKENVPEQTYYDHVFNVYNESIRNVSRMGSKKFHDFLIAIVGKASLFHDLGKLDEYVQMVLRGELQVHRMLNHVDAGTYHLLMRFEQSRNWDDLLAAWLVCSHHRGFEDFIKLGGNRVDVTAVEHGFRDQTVIRQRYPYLDIDGTVAERINQQLENYLVDHNSIFDISLTSGEGRPTSLLLKFALSCLVDADHEDTARNYLNVVPDKTLLLQPADRLLSLIESVASWKKDDSLRTKVREEVFSVCVNTPVTEGLEYCASEVGTGKTTALMGRALKCATDLNKRRIFYIAPLITILSQNVEVIRKTILLDGEDPFVIIGENHSGIDFESGESPLSRACASTFSPPIVFTTIVQFFETLAGCKTGKLRKSHNIPNSVIVIDESHMALPPRLWPVALRWLAELSETWNCKIIFGSGTLVKFWDIQCIKDIAKRSFEVANLIPEELGFLTLSREKDRVQFVQEEQTLNVRLLTDLVMSYSGSRLVVLNTVRSAATVANHFRDLGANVYHLSTSLCPIDMEVIVEEVKAKLEAGEDLTLVATSCVECGVNFSFQNGFRENCSLFSLLQVSGRVNRNDEYPGARVISFDLYDEDYGCRENPDFRISSAILKELFKFGRVGPEFSSWAMEQEIRAEGGDSIAKRLVQFDEQFNFESLAKGFKVIPSMKVGVIVYKDVAARLREGVPVPSHEITRKSVQLYEHDLERYKFQINRLTDDFGRDFRIWHGEYDPNFLGYLAEDWKKIGV